MLPINIQIELCPYFADSDLQDLLSRRDIVYQKDLSRRNHRKKPHQNVMDYLNSHVPGRQNQIQQVSKYIQNLKLGDKSPLFLQGSTGCGKTSIIMALIDYMKQNHQQQYQILYINCLRFTNVRKIYSFILQELFDHHSKEKKPQQTISSIFQGSQQVDDSIIRVIVFDEIDQCFGNKAFIYNILEWAQSSHIPLGTILISNMVDFSANLQNKSKSRIKFGSIIFKPYHYKQLIEITKYKCSDSIDSFDEDAIVFLCKKVASINSDVRLLQKYFNEALRKNKRAGRKISIGQIQALFSSETKGLTQLIKPFQFLLQILWRSPRGKNIAIDIEHYCLANAIKQYSQNQVLYLLGEMEQMGIAKIHKERKISDFCYNSWGIVLEEYAYKLEAIRQKK